MKRSDSAGEEKKNVYDIKQKIGEGDYGSVVYKAQRNDRGDLAVVKMFPASESQTDYIKNLRRMSDLDTIHVLKLYGMMIQDKSLWVALEYCEGRSLSDIMSVFGRALKETHIRTVLLHVLKGLDYLHHLSIIHRGIKARNILVNSQGVCKLAEFGTAGHGADTVTMDSFVDNSFWLAPEVLQEVQYNTQADIWSVGITLMELGEGKTPHAGMHPMRVMLNIPNQPPPSFDNPELWTKPLKTFLKCCLQKVPKERATASQLLQHKIIKRADWKGLQGMITKAVKVLDSNQCTVGESSKSEGFLQRIRNAVSEPIEDDCEDNSAWAESGTIVWKPINTKPSLASVLAPPRSAASISDIQLEVDPEEEYEMATVRPADFAKAKQQKEREEMDRQERELRERNMREIQELKDKERQEREEREREERRLQEEKVVLRDKSKSKGKENRRSKNLEVLESDRKKENRKSKNMEVDSAERKKKENRKSHSLEPPLDSKGSISPKISPKTKQNRLSQNVETESFITSQYDYSTVELFGASSKSNSKSRSGSVPSESKQSASVEQPSVETSGPRPKPSVLDNGTIKIADGKVNSAAPDIPSPAQLEPEPSFSVRTKSIDEIPYFMQYYDRKDPATFIGEMPLEKKSLEELEAELEELSYETGEQMERIKQTYTTHWWDIVHCVLEKGGSSPTEPPNVYKLLTKSELLMQLSMIQHRHKSTSSTLTERFRLEKQFIRDTARQFISTKPGEDKVEERSNSMTRDLEHKEKDYQHAMSGLKKDYRMEYDYILKALEYVDYTMVIKSEN